jgi:hypothetical protein
MKTKTGILNVLLCAHIAAILLPAEAATSPATCETFKKGIDAAQAAARNADIAAANQGFTNIQNAASQFKKACMDEVVSYDVSSLGLGNAGTKLLMNAAQKVCDAAAQQVGSYQQQATNVVNQKIDEQVNKVPTPVRDVVNPGSTSSNGNVISDGWQKLRQMLN